MQSRDESKDDGEEVESISSAQDSLECGERSSEDDLQSETSVSPATAANDGQPKRTSKKKKKENQPSRDHGPQMQGKQRTVT